MTRRLSLRAPGRQTSATTEAACPSSTDSHTPAEDSALLCWIPQSRFPSARAPNERLGASSGSYGGLAPSRALHILMVPSPDALTTLWRGVGNGRSESEPRAANSYRGPQRGVVAVVEAVTDCADSESGKRKRIQTRAQWAQRGEGKARLPAPNAVIRWSVRLHASAACGGQRERNSGKRVWT